MSQGTLYVVATPIGNLDDLSPRARRILSEVDAIAAEDTRRSGKLLANFTIQSRLFSLHDHNEAEMVDGIIERLLGGESFALISDAGTPLISDPGYRLVVAAHRSKIVVSPIPGPNAAIAAISASGLATDRFAFEGFLPPKVEARRTALQSLREETRTLIFYESVHRVKNTVGDMQQILGAERAAFVGRELTKIHEQCVSDSLQNIVVMFDSGSIALKGEFVIAVAGAPHQETDQSDVAAKQLLEELMPVMPASQAVEIAVRISGLRRNAVYQLMLDAQANEL